MRQGVILKHCGGPIRPLGTIIIMTKIPSTILLLTAVLAAYSANLQAQDEIRSTNDGYQSGYGTIPEFGGPDGVSGELARNDKNRQSVHDFDTLQRVFLPYFDWKRRLHDNHGISFGIQYYLLPQLATSSRGDKDALGGIFRFQGTWTLFDRGGFHPGRLEWRLESRSNVFGQQSPMDLSGQIGAAAANTGFPYTTTFDLDLAVINWTQGFNKSTAGAAIGRLAFDVYLDAMPFQTIGKGFINRAFILNPTIATTGIGALGAVTKGFVTDQIWIGGQIHDANAVGISVSSDTGSYIA